MTPAPGRARDDDDEGRARGALRRRDEARQGRVQLPERRRGGVDDDGRGAARGRGRGVEQTNGTARNADAALSLVKGEFDRRARGDERPAERLEAVGARRARRRALAAREARGEQDLAAGVLEEPGGRRERPQSRRQSALGLLLVPEEPEDARRSSVDAYLAAGRLDEPRRPYFWVGSLSVGSSRSPPRTTCSGRSPRRRGARCR